MFNAQKRASRKNECATARPVRPDSKEKSPCCAYAAGNETHADAT
jgi:hypothetical protein